jgi:dihydrodipicolinate synthase/N-acetylneuraminate lyase
METTNNPNTNWRVSLSDGLVIPALPLTLDGNGDWSRRHQQAVMRYYIDAGAGGIAAGVHSTQFEIRNPEHALFEPVLRLMAEAMDRWAPADFVRIAGICGGTDQARHEASLAAETGYHAGLLSLAAFSDQPEEAAISHAQSIAKLLPIVGFYLQPAVGGRVFSYDFWRRFCEIEDVVAIKIAPFNRYQTWDVIRAVIESGRENITLYTGNDDNIIADLLTPFVCNGQTRFIHGGLLGQWGVWTRQAVEMLEEINTARSGKTIAADWLTRNASLTDANAAVFDVANGFAGCIPGILEVLRRQGLAPSVRCLNPDEVLSPGQCEELDRVCRSYPELTDDAFVSQHLEAWLDG